jgi:hypothetical protein
MMRRDIRLLLVISLANVFSAQAQTAPAPQRGPDFATRSITPGVEVLSYTGLPFSGIDTVVRTVPLAGGGSIAGGGTVDGGGFIVTSAISKVARDSQGRVYRERHHFAPAGVDPRKTLYEFYILDPIAHTNTACTIDIHSCTITSYNPQLSFRLMPVGPFDNGKQLLTRDSLGQQTLDGLPVTGTRETTTISPGTIGNDRAITLTRDFWFSNDLMTNLAVTRIDPREGTTDIHLTVQSRAEPDPSTFAIPTNYTVFDSRRVARHAD